MKNQITIILFKIWPTNRFPKAKSYNFHFNNNYATWPLGAKWRNVSSFIQIACAIRTIKHDRQIQDVKRMFSVAYILKIAVHIRWVVCSCYFSVRLFVNCPSFSFAIYKTWTELAQTRPQGFLVAISFSGNIAVLLKTSE